MLIWTAGVLDTFNDHNKYLGTKTWLGLLCFTSDIPTYKLTEVKLGNE